MFPVNLCLIAEFSADRSVRMHFHKKYISVNKKTPLPYDPTFYKILREVARDPVVLSMKIFPHHGDTNCYTHCLHVAYFNYKLCRRLHLDYHAAAKAGMLHDPSL